MSNLPSSGPEQLVELPRLGSGEASSQLVELAKQAGYEVAATAPGVYRLARTRRRMVVSKRTESVTVSVFEDKDGTKARVVGDLDHSILQRLRSAGEATPLAGRQPQGSVPTAGSMPAAQTSPSATRSIPPSFQRPAGPSSTTSAPAPTPPRPAGLVTGVPGYSTPSLPSPPVPPGVAEVPATPLPASPGVVPPPLPPPLPATADDGFEARTVAKSALQRSSTPAVVLPDGRRFDLSAPVVIGRNPDVAKAPNGAQVASLDDQSMSKTHLVVEVSHGAVCVTDLHSMNGTTFETAGASARCVGGIRSPVPTGATVRAGQVELQIEGTP